MSNIQDKDGKIINAPGYGTTNGAGQCRYKDTGCTEIDWFATHPRPVEKTPAPVQEILATEKGTLEFKGEDGTRIQATTPLAPVVVNPPAQVFPPALVAAAVQPPYEDESGKTWLYNPATTKWDIPAPVTNEAAPSGSDVPQV